MNTNQNKFKTSIVGRQKLPISSRIVWYTLTAILSIAFVMRFAVDTVPIISSIEILYGVLFAVEYWLGLNKAKKKERYNKHLLENLPYQLKNEKEVCLN